jgi:HSP20 family molecular chaperone IbpA
VDKRRDIHEAAEQIEELFSDLWQVFPFARGARGGHRPQVDVFQSDDPPSIVIHVELPGVDPEHVKLVAGPRALIVAGERQRPKDCGHYRQMEIEYGPFQRRVVLGEDIDPDRATATYERGILRITLPIAPKPEARESVSIVVSRNE